MSILQYPEGTTKKSSTQLHVWNNAAFDGKEELQGSSFPMKTCSWSSDCSKENLSPAALDSSPVSAIKHNFGTSCILGNSQSQNILKLNKKKEGSEQEDEKRIDDEIEEIENEIKRLTSRLEALRLEKAAAAKTVEKKGRIVAAKFMEPPKQGFVKKIEETPKAKVNNNMRRGVSLGPAEIASRGGGRSSRKADIVTPVPATQNRRKSCFWKLEEIGEGKGKGKGVSERRKSSSLSPKLGKLMGRVNLIQGQRQAATTANLGSRKCVKKEEEVLALVQPRKLFKEGGKSVPNNKNKILKPGRVVASRYNQIANNQSNGNSVAVDARKRLLPENENDDYGGGRCDKRRASSVRAKKRWEIPAEVVVYKSEDKLDEEEEEKASLLSSSSIADMSDVWLPKIKTLRSANESPRDSGAAKRVAELEGKRSYFCPDKDVEASVCQVLSFAEDANEEE